jgi:hypothetical protein
MFYLVAVGLEVHNYHRYCDSDENPGLQLQIFNFDFEKFKIVGCYLDT